MEHSSEEQQADQAAASPSAELPIQQESADDTRTSRFQEDIPQTSVGTTSGETTQIFEHDDKNSTQDSTLDEPRITLTQTARSDAVSESPQIQLSQARQTLIQNEMQDVLQQVQGLEQRISKTCSVLTDQEQDLKIREAKAAQREDWLRHRENSVLRRERNAQRREHELADNELLRSASMSKVEAQDHNRKSSTGSSASTLLRSLTARKKALVFKGEETSEEDSSTTAPETPCPKKRGSLHERYQSDGARLGCNSDKAIVQRENPDSNEHSGDSFLQRRKPIAPLVFKPSSLNEGDGEPFEESAGTPLLGLGGNSHSSGHPPLPSSTLPETPVRRSFIKRFSPFTPPTPPPPYRSPSTIRKLIPATGKLSFWSKARMTGGNVLNHVLHPMDPEDTEGLRKQRRINKLEQELRDADARLEKARRDERQKALDRVKELQGL